MRNPCLRLIPCLLTAALASACGDHPPAHEQPLGVAPGLGPRATPAAEPEPAPAPAPAPKLVVLVVVDQMRFDYYERFAGQWQHGFARLRDEGRTFGQAFHEHALTETAPGHATISTGVDPADHGVVANGWLDRATGRKRNAVEDPNAQILGAEADAKSLSATNLLREAVGDWLQAQRPEAVVVALALKDRAAILLGGKRPDFALWYDDALGGFTSSTAYADALPDWVAAYNHRDRAQALYGEDGWTLSRPAADYGDSRPRTEDELVTEFNDYALSKEFPHVIIDPAKAPRNVVRDTPFGDQMTLELAREALAAAQLGADEVPDLLLIGLSGGDYAGHRYGPNSVEIHDYYLRMDAALGEFIAALDSQFGKDDYVLILTSDHGVAPMPEHSDIAGAGRFDARVEVPAMLERVVEELALAATPKLAFSHGVELEFAAELDEATRAKVRARLAELMREDPRVADAWTRDELLGAEQRNEYAAAWRRSFHPERSSDLLIQFAPGVVAYPEGTGHGTPYAYDQHVPLIIRGRGWAGVANQRVATVDIAPTIAQLVGVAPPADLDGAPISAAE